MFLFFCYHKQLFLISKKILVEKQNKENLVDSGIVRTCDELDLIEGSPSFLIFVVPFLQWNDS